MGWQYHILILIIITGHGHMRANSKLFSPDFYSDLISMKGSEGVAWRQRIMRDIPRLGAKIDRMGLEECTGRVLSVMKALGCKNTANGLEMQVHVNQFLYASFSNPQIYESLIQQNCTILSGRNAKICHMILAGAQLYVNASGLVAGISKCYQESITAFKIGMSHR